MNRLKTLAALMILLTAVACKTTTSPSGSSGGSPAGSADGTGQSSSTRILGTIRGNIEVEGEPAAGIQVLVTAQLFLPGPDAPDRTTTTDSAGNFMFQFLESEVYMLLIQNPIIGDCKGSPPSPITFAEDGEVQTVKIECKSRSGTARETLRISGGDPSHDPFVFSAGKLGKKARITFRMGPSANTIIIEGSTFGPSPLPPLTGTIDADGRFTVRGQGLIAGVPGVSVVASGRFYTEDVFFQWQSVEIDKLVVGGAGELPKETPIIYEFKTETVP